MKKVLIPLFGGLIFLILIWIIGISFSFQIGDGSSEVEKSQSNFEFKRGEKSIQIPENRLNNADIPENGIIDAVIFLRKNEDPCGYVVPVKRQVAYENRKLEKATLQELLEGPTKNELEEGFVSSISLDTEIQGISVQHGIAFLDFNRDLEAGINSECEAQNVRAQIEQTLKQFETVNDVQIYIGGKTENKLQK